MIELSGEDKPKMIWIACGGTGGHLFPGIAVAQVLKRKGQEVCLIVSSKAIDQIALTPYPDLDRIVLPLRGFPGFHLGLGSFIISFFKSLKLCHEVIRRRRPKVVLGMGGFVTVPALLGAVFNMVPFVMHESNAIPGRVTRWFAPWAHKVLVGFERCLKHLKAKQTVVTGTPVRVDLLPGSQLSEESGSVLKSSRPLLLVLGGSQGARGINDLILDTVSIWGHLLTDWQLWHLAGPFDADRVRRAYQEKNIPAVVEDFSHQMGTLMSVAGLCVSRAGASTLTELSSYKLPCILVPYPHAADDHQTANAEEWVRAGAAILVRQHDVQQFANELASLMVDEGRRRYMSDRAARLSYPSAAEKISEEVLDVF